MASQLNWTGGCLCGTVRYALKSEPFDCGWCHCRSCQLTSGAPSMYEHEGRQYLLVTAAGPGIVAYALPAN